MLSAKPWAGSTLAQTYDYLVISMPSNGMGMHPEISRPRVAIYSCNPEFWHWPSIIAGRADAVSTFAAYLVNRRRNGTPDRRAKGPPWSMIE
jgi:hypothetical protein